MRRTDINNWFSIPSVAIGMAALMALASIPAQAEARVALSEETHINETLRAAVVGARIKNHCDEIAGNYLVAYEKAKALKKYAMDLGYSADEIDAYIDDEAEQKRVRWAASRYLEENGATKDNAASYCALGRAEIASGSLIGQLLRLQ